MYTGLLHFHSGLRWLILLGLLITISKYLIGLLGKKKWTKGDQTIGVIFTALMDLQFLTGIVLYFFYSPITQSALKDFGGAMRNTEIRFYAVEHLLLMFLAVVFVHIGKIKSKKAITDRSKFTKILLWFAFACILILAGIPWNRV